MAERREIISLLLSNTVH